MLTKEMLRLRALAIVAPLVFLTVVAYLVRGPFHEELHSFPGFLYVLGFLAAAVSLFSCAIFALFGNLERQIVQRNRQLEAVLAVGRATGSSLQLSDVLDAALDEILAVTSAEASEVWLRERDELALERQRGLDEKAFRERTRLRVGEGLPGVAAESGRPLVVHDIASHPCFVRPRVVALGFRAFAAFPLVRGGEIVGVLGVASRDAKAFSGDVEHRLLEGIGEQVAVVIENARLHGRVLDAAVLEERERLARELHDGLAQLLGYVNTQTLAIKKLLRSGRREDAQAEVAQMEKTARRVYTDVREAILGLRSSNGGLLEGVRSYVADFGQLAGLDVRLEIDDGAEKLSLPPSAEFQLVRIVQEALANVRKHADARTARVTVATGVNGELLVAVEDDGRGFAHECRQRTGWPHFGLQTMRERAEAIGGTLELDSQPGAGTRVRVSYPLRPREAIGAHPAR